MADQQYRERFIQAVRLYMAEKNMDAVKAAAEQLEINYGTLHKIMNRDNFPTVDQATLLCKKGGFSANWMFLNIGDKYLKQQANMDRLFSELKAIKSEVSRWE